MADEPQDGTAPAKAAPERDATTNEGGAGTSPAAAPAKAAAAPPATAAPAASAPAKPTPAAVAKPAAKADGGDLTRRGFFSWAAVAWVGFSAAIGGCVTAMGRFMFPNVLFEPPTSFKAGRPEDYQPGIVDTRLVDKYGVWIVNNGGQHLRPDRHLHPPRLHAQLAGDAEQVQVPLPRQRLLHHRHQLRRAGPAAARAGQDRPQPTTARSSSTRRRSSSRSSASGTTRIPSFPSRPERKRPPCRSKSIHQVAGLEEHLPPASRRTTATAWWSCYQRLPAPAPGQRRKKPASD